MTTDSVEKSKKEYGLQYAKAMYADFRNGNAQMFYQYRNQIIENRAYANGRQSPHQYKRVIDVQDSDLSFINIDWRIAAIVPKFVDMAVNDMLRYDGTLNCSALDPITQDTKENMYWKKYVDIKHKADLDELSEKLGVPPREQDETQPQSIEELDLWMSEFKTRLEVAMELGIQHVYNLNDWDELEKRLKRDLFVDGIAGLKEYFLDNGIIKIRAVDALNLVVGYTDRPDFKNIKHIGEIIPMTIEQLCKIAGPGEMDDDAKMDLASKFQGKYGNPMLPFNSTPNITGNGQPWQPFTYPVMEFEFKSIDCIVNEVRKNKYGNTHVYKADNTFQADKKDKSRARLDTEYEAIYGGFWVVGTDYIFKYEKQCNQKRDSQNPYEAEFSFHLNAPSLRDNQMQSHVERTIPFANSFQLGWLKIQNLKAETAPPTTAIEISGLMGIPVGKGGKTLQPLEVIKLRTQKGILLWNRKSVSGDAHNYKPIEDIPSYFAQQLDGYINSMNFDLDMLRAVTGINEIADASTPNPNQPVGTSKLALNASSTAKLHLLLAYKNIKVNCAKGVAQRIQMLEGKKNVPEVYRKALGDAVTNVIKQSGDIALAEWGITVDDVPMDEEKAWLEQQIALAMQQRTQSGKGGIELEDAIVIRRVKNLKLAEQLLVMRRKRREMKDAQDMMNNQKVTADQAIRQKQAADESEIQKAARIALIQMAVTDHTKEWDWEIAQLNNLGKMMVATKQAVSNQQLQQSDQFHQTQLSRMESQQSQADAAMGGGSQQQAPQGQSALAF